jgi:cobalt/nickel transport system permease protein
MGVVGTLGGFTLYMLLCRVLGGEDRARIPASAVAGWASVVAAAAFMSVELIVSGTSPAELVLPAMLGVHAFIGVGEALITAAALAFIAATRKDLLDLRPDRAAALARRTGGTGIAGTAGTPAPTPAVKP